MFYAPMEPTEQGSESYLLGCKASQRLDYLYIQLDRTNQCFEKLILRAVPDACRPDEAGAARHPASRFYPLLLPIREPDLAEREVEVAIRLYGHCGVAIPCAPGPVRQGHHGVIARIARLCQRLGVPLVLMDCSRLRTENLDVCGCLPATPDGATGPAGD